MKYVLIAILTTVLGASAAFAASCCDGGDCCGKVCCRR